MYNLMKQHDKTERVTMRIVYAINIVFALLYMNVMHSEEYWVANNRVMIICYSFFLGAFIILNIVLFTMTVAYANGYARLPVLLSMVAVGAVLMMIDSANAVLYGRFWDSVFMSVLFWALTGVICMHRYIGLNSERKLLRKEMEGQK